MIRQMADHSIDHFMRSLCTKYVRYFNSHYKRIGPLFQGPYKAVQVVSESQFMYLSKYIHRNPLGLRTFQQNARPLSEYKYSSYANYLHTFSQPWVHPDDILSYFTQTIPRQSYRQFVEESDPDDIVPVTNLTLDLD